MIEVEKITDKDILLFGKEYLKVQRFNEENPWNFKIDQKNPQEIDRIFDSLLHQAVHYKMRRLEDLEVIKKEIGSPDVTSPRDESQTPSPGGETPSFRQRKTETETKSRRRSLSEVLFQAFVSNSSDTDEIDIFKSAK